MDENTFCFRIVQSKLHIGQQVHHGLFKTKTSGIDQSFLVFVRQHHHTAVKIEIILNIFNHDMRQLIHIQYGRSGLPYLLHETGAPIAIINFLDVVLGRVPLILDHAGQFLFFKDLCSQIEPHHTHATGKENEP